MQIIDEKKSKSKKSIVKDIGVIIVTFIVSTIIVASFRETIDVNEITTYEKNLEEITKEVEVVENQISTIQKSIDELQSFIDENNN